MPMYIINPTTPNKAKILIIDDDPDINNRSLAQLH